MKALIVGAAPVTGSESLLCELAAECDLVVAADAAAEWCVAAGVMPSLAVGDFDSAVSGAPDRLRSRGITVVEFPPEKDRTDLDLAVTIACDAGATALVFTACTAARIDHTLAALGTMSAHADLCPVLREPHMSAWVVSPAAEIPFALSLPIGTTISVIPIGQVSGVTLTGFKYPLDQATLEPLSSHGLSNVTVDSRVTVSVRSGTLFVMQARDV
jgi:thiamine pyrophosphokinase